MQLHCCEVVYLSRITFSPPASKLKIASSLVARLLSNRARASNCKEDEKQKVNNKSCYKITDDAYT